MLPQVAAVVTQCGLSTITKALAAGVPLVCLPVLGDQPENAARIVALGAGIRLRPSARADEIRAAIQRVLDEPDFREAAQRVAVELHRVNGAEAAAIELESLAPPGAMV